MDNNVKTFPGWWAVLFVIISFNLIPIPFAVAISFFGDWVYQNPVQVDMNYIGSVSMHPIADNLTSIFSMIALVGFILWRMSIRNIPLSSLGSLNLRRNELVYGLIALALFIGLEEIYMFLLGIEMPEGFIEFMLSEPILLGLISVVIIAPLAEEFLFRGFLFSQLSQTRLGGWGTIFLTSFIWTIIHFQYEVLILLILFVFGIFLGYLRFAYNSLSLPVALHAVNNAFAFFMAFYFF